MKDKVSILMSDPELSKFWSNKNTLNIHEVTRGSQNKTWWNCPNGENHSFERCINKFLNGRSKCPYCSNNQLLKGFNDLKTKYPKIAKEYSNTNIIKADEIIFTSTQKVEWSGNCGHSWKATVNSRTKHNNNCPYCSNNLVLKGFNDLLTTHPDASSYWNYEKNTLKITEVSRGSNKIAWWLNPNCNHSFKMSIKHHKFDGSQCLICPRHFSHKSKDNFMERCLKDEDKNKLIEEWDYEKNFKNPYEMGSYSNYRAWWICGDCSHKWQATVANRFKGTSCPKCWKNNSNFEKAVYEYLQKLYKGEILRNKRPLTTSDGVKRELDFWIPELQIAFEVNDFTTHSRDSNKELVAFKYANIKDTFKKGPLYHREKLLLTREQLDCNLYFIWEDEVLNNNFKNIIHEALKDYLV